MQELIVKITSNDTTEEITVVLPSKWNELTSKQLLYIASMWQTWRDTMQRGATMLHYKTALFIELMNNTEAEKKKVIEWLGMIKKTDVNIFSTLDFLFNDITLTKNLFPTLSLGVFSKYYGPHDGLANVSIGEFSFAITFYNRYSKTKNIADLDKLIAILYRPKNKNADETGDARKPFKKHLIEAYEIELRQLQLKYKQAVYLYFIGCMEAWSRRYQFVFSKAEGSSSGSGTPFINIIIELAGGKFGTFDQTFEQNADIVLTELNNLLKPKKK